MTPSDATEATPVLSEGSSDPFGGDPFGGDPLRGTGPGDDNVDDTDGTDWLEMLVGVVVLLVGGIILLAGIIVVGAFVLLTITGYAVFFLLANALLFGWALVSGVFYWLKTRIDGKAIMKRRLEGRIPLLKQTAIELGLDLVELEFQKHPDRWVRPIPALSVDDDTPQPPLSRAEVKMYRRRFGFEEQSTNRWFTLWLPLVPQLRAWLASDEAGANQKDEAGVLRTLFDGVIGWIRRRFGAPGDGEMSESDDSPYVKAFESVAEVLGHDGGDRQPFPPHTRWVYDTMYLLNTADSSMRRSMVTAYEAYLKAKRDIVEGEYIYHKQRTEDGDDGTEHDSAEQFLKSEASVVLYGLDEYDERTRMIVTDILCGFEDDGTNGPRLGDEATVAELKRALAQLPDAEADGIVADDGMTLAELKQAMAQLPRGDGGSGSGMNDEMTLAELRQLLTELNEHRTREFQQLKRILEDIHDATERTVPKPKPGLTITELKQALEEVHEFRLQEYRRFEVLRINILMFVGMPAMSLVGLLLVAPSFMGRFPSLIGETLVPLQELLTPETLGSTLFLFTVQNQSVVVHPEQVFFGLVLGFGALGAALSGMRKIEHDSGRSESLESILGYWLALVRMAIGAISAFVVLVFLSSGLVDPNILSLPLVLGISAASGVSERLALRAISSFESRAMPEHDRTK